MRDQILYELLQVSENADQEIIQAAWRRLVLRYHSDRSSEPNATEMTQRLNDAYAILSDPARKAQYDREYRERTSISSGGTGQTSSRSSQSRPNPAPPPPWTPPPRRASTPPCGIHVEFPRCKKSVIPTKGEPFNWMKFLILGGLPWLIWGEQKREKSAMCSNCGKPFLQNLLEPERRFDI